MTALHTLVQFHMLSRVSIDFHIGSLCCESPEEAKTLIPSLANKISDGDLQELLDEIMKMRLEEWGK